MATIDLGKIKLVWRGTYAGGTAYTVDDVVQHTDSGLTSSFICTTASTGNAPSTGGTVHGSWAYLAKGGTAGTDVGTTITTQGDLLYRDGSGLQRLAKGTAGQALKMNTAANAPEWGTISSDYVKIASTTLGSDTAYIDALSCFSSDYKQYKIFAESNHASDNANQLVFKFITATNTVQTGDYCFSGYQAYRNSSTSGGGNYGSWNQNDLRPNENMSTDTNLPVHYDMTIFDPSSSSNTTSFSFLYCGWDSTYLRSVYGGGMWNNNTVVTGIRMLPHSSGNLKTGARISIYGIKA